MHIHVCPQEIMALMLIWDSVQAYAYHYKHLVIDILTKTNTSNTCDVCDE